MFNLKTLISKMLLTARNKISKRQATSRDSRRRQDEPRNMNAKHAMNELMLTQARLLNLRYSGQFEEWLGCGRLWKLEQELNFVDLAFDNCIALLEQLGTLEHSCLEEAVAACNDLPDEISVVLELLEEIGQIGKRIPDAIILRVSQAVVELEYVGGLMRETCNILGRAKEQERQNEQREISLDSNAWWANGNCSDMEKWEH